MTQQNAFSGFQTDPFFNQFRGNPGGFNTGSSTFPGFEDFLEEGDEGRNLAFQGALSQANLPFNQLQAAQRRRESIFNQFRGQQRFNPSLRLAPFLDAFNFQRDLFRTPLGQRGTEQSQPRTTFRR